VKREGIPVTSAAMSAARPDFRVLANFEAEEECPDGRVPRGPTTSPPPATRSIGRFHTAFLGAAGFVPLAISAAAVCGSRRVERDQAIPVRTAA
jgi:hypothetical protein